jgi:hypothetical protein
MLTRIRLDALGYTAEEVERTLYPHADKIEKLIGRGISRGECVIERDVVEPDDSKFAWKGRLVLHVDIQPGFTVTSSTCTVSSTGAGTASNAA